LQGFGTLLVAAAARLVTPARYPWIVFSLRDDVPTHQFWRAIGADLIGVRPGGSRRQKMILDYQFTLPQTARLADTITHPDRSLDHRFEEIKPWSS